MKELLQNAIKERMSGTQHGDIPLIESIDTVLRKAIVKTGKTYDRLMKRGTRVQRAIASGIDINEENLLFEAIEKRGDIEEVRELIEAGADVNAVNIYRYHRSPIFMAARHFLVDIIKELVKHGADVNMRSVRFGYTALYEAVTAEWSDNTRITNSRKAGRVETVRELLRSGADPNEDHRIPATMSILTLAVAKGHPDVVEELIEAGADVEAKDPDGWRPLHFAASFDPRHGLDLRMYYPVGHPEIIRILMRAGADPFAKTNGGAMPIDLAKRKSVKKVIEDEIKKVMSDSQYGDIPLLESKRQRRVSSFL